MLIIVAGVAVWQSSLGLAEIRPKVWTCNLYRWTDPVCQGARATMSLWSLVLAVSLVFVAIGLVILASALVALVRKDSRTAAMHAPKPKADPALHRDVGHRTVDLGWGAACETCHIIWHYSAENVRPLQPERR